MNHMKSLVALLLAMLMVLSMTVAYAEPAEDETYSITINNATAGHTYEAYQIFTGDLSSNADNDAADGTKAVLSNIVWGASVTSYNNAPIADSNAADIAESLTDKATLEDFIGKLVLSAPVATSTVSGNTYVISGLEPGYYLVKDKDNSLTGHDAYTEFIIEVVENSTVNPKSSVPTVEKKVDDKNDSNATEDAVDWQDSADYDIGDNVPFKLTATLANNVTSYETYKVIFHDTLSAGLTYNKDAKVYLNGNDVTSYFTISESNGVLTISCDNVKEFGATNSSAIIVEYTAELNENAVIGSTGNPNTVYLEYSNNPNKSAFGDTNNTGNTPEDKVIVFTYKVVVNKVDENEAALVGAGFTLYKKNSAGEYVAIGKELTGDDMTQFVWERLDDGDYKLVETTTPAGYNTITPIEFTISAEHDIKADDPKLISMTGNGATGEVTFTRDTVEDGALTTDVINKSGTVLPETGGIGTTLFYTIGGVLVLAAVVLLVTKRRMSAND